MHYDTNKIFKVKRPVEWQKDLQSNFSKDFLNLISLDQSMCLLHHKNMLRLCYGNLPLINDRYLCI